MKVKKYLDLVAYKSQIQIGPEKSDVYKSKFDDSYITHIGIEDSVKYLAEREITDQLTHGVGYSPKDEKWYGWSHRAIFGFKVGSTCKKGDAHYVGETLKAQEEDAIRFWSDPGHINVKSKGMVMEDGERFFDIQWEYDDTVPNDKIRGTISGVRHRVTALGRGEWTAKTMDDARKMAIDFNEGVS